MKKNNKKILLIGISLIAVILIIFGVFSVINQPQEKESSNSVEYIEGSDESSQSETSVSSTSVEDKTQSEVDEAEDIDAEQIVAKIMADGYVTSHGDHYHYYSGKVPSDALFSEELLLDASEYTLNEADVQYEVDNGYIIKQGDDYYLYLKDPNQTDSIRTVEQIKSQQESQSSDTGSATNE